MDKRRLARALQRRARRLEAAVRWSGGLAGRFRRGADVAAERNTDDVLRSNLDHVMAALTSAGLRPFVVPGFPGEGPRVGVTDADGPTVLAALRAHRGEFPLYVKAKWLPAARVDAADPRYLSDVAVARVFTRHGEKPRPDPLAAEYACVVEVWSRSPHFLSGPRPNAVATKVPVELAQPGEVEVLGRRYPSLRPFDLPDHVDRVPFDIDLVYTWVDGTDPAWAARQDAARAAAGDLNWHRAAANRGRYADREELRYSLRSVWMYADFFRMIYIVTDRQVPIWLRDHPRIRVVDHSEIFGDAGRLPTFNSHAIESRLHHIDGLSEHFVYCNDDMFIGRRLSPHAFFHPNGLCKFLPSPFELDPGPASPADNPAEVAGKNNRALLRERYPTLVTHKLRHAPYPLRRSVLLEMEQAYPEHFAATAASQFRSPQDYSVASSLSHYYAYVTQRALPTHLTFAYVDISRPDTRAVRSGLRAIARTRPQVFCVNDVDGDVAPEHELMAHAFFESMYPTPSPFEK